MTADGKVNPSGLSIWNRVSAVLENPRAYFKLAVSKEEDLPQLKDLHTSLKSERQELEDNVRVLKDLSQSMFLLVKQKREELFKHMLGWKKSVIDTQMTHSKACI